MLNILLKPDTGLFRIYGKWFFVFNALKLGVE